MKKISFEQAWQKVFEEASEEPSKKVWDGINAQIEDDLVLEKTFRAKLENASTVVTPSVWDNIEKQLDQEKDRKIPFIWWNSRVAAGIAALVLFSVGLLYGPSLFKNEPLAKEASNTPTTTASQNVKRTAATLSATVEANSRANAKPSEKQNNLASTNGVFKRVLVEKTLETGTNKGVRKTADYTAEVNTLPRIAYHRFTENSETTIGKINAKPFEEYGNRFKQFRKKLSFENDIEEAFVWADSDKKSWFGFISGLAPFDPNISINNFERAAILSSNDIGNGALQFNSVIETGSDERKAVFSIPLSQPFNEVNSGRSVNVGFDLGQKLTRKIGFQTGARYMNGLSYIVSNVFTYNEKTGQVSTFLASHYLEEKNNFYDNTVIASQGGIENAYQFIMIPAQLSYHQPLMKNIELAVTAGISGDFMINNVIDNISKGGSNLKPGNSAYNTAILSSLGGLKLNYTIGKNWQTSIGGTYQQSLSSGINARQENLNFKPKYIGINYGFNYRF